MTRHARKLVLMPDSAYRVLTFRTAFGDTLDRITSLIEMYQINGVDPFTYATEKDSQIADVRNRGGDFSLTFVRIRAKMMPADR